MPIGVFGFQGTSGTLLTPGSFSLGQFNARDLPADAGLTYHNLPFYISMDLQDGPSSNLYSYLGSLSIAGVLNGTVAGTNQSDVTATITSVQAIPSLPDRFPLDLGSLHFDVPQVLAPSGVNDGRTTLTAEIQPVPVPIPEPGPIALAGLVMAWVGRRWTRPGVFRLGAGTRLHATRGRGVVM